MNIVTDNATFITTTGLVFTLFMGLLIVVLPRRFALVPVFALMCLMTMGERLMIGGLNFTMIRILLLFGWTRLLFKKEIRSIRFNKIDVAIILWVISSMVLHNVLWQDGKEFQNTLGMAYDSLGMYFLFRFLLRDARDIVHALKIFAFFVALVAVSMLGEKLTGRDAFAAFGGVNAITVQRDGVLRCQGPFLHPILAGTFGAVVAPLFASLWRRRDTRKVAALAVLSSTTIVLTSGSSGPVLTYMCGMLALCLWPLRQYMRIIRWLIVSTLVVLHLAMKAPVWYVLAKVTVFSASDNWHRAFLINQAIVHFGDWWFCGTKETVSWGSHLDDVTNQFIGQGVYGGVLTMILFIAIIVVCFSNIGSAIRSLGARSKEVQFLLWSMGAALLAHVVTFISVSYFDQNAVNWSLLLAMISAATSSVLFARQTARLPSLQPQAPVGGEPRMA